MKGDDNESRETGSFGAWRSFRGPAGHPAGCIHEAGDCRQICTATQKQFGKTAEALKDYSSEQRDKALEKAKKSLDELDSQISAMEDDLYEKWDQMDQESRNTYRSNLNEFRKQRSQVAEWFGAMSHSAENAWEDMKEGSSTASAISRPLLRRRGAGSEFTPEKLLREESPHTCCTYPRKNPAYGERSWFFMINSCGKGMTDE